MWFASHKEVRRMIEQALIATIYILFYSLVGVTIIAIALIIALAIILSKSE
jgi:ABC-type dipeptide/oligopeptide/nickel transport system permease component